MPRAHLLLFIAPPAVTLLYALLEYFGVLDWLTGRKYALEGLKRLQSTAGYPVSVVYDDAQDGRVFRALERRITRRSKLAGKTIKGRTVSPTGITIAGKPVLLDEVPSEWPQEQRFVYTPQHPILFLFGATRGVGGGKARRVCSLGDLEKWLLQEKEARKHCVGAVAIGLISIGLIVLRLSVIS